MNKQFLVLALLVLTSGYVFAKDVAKEVAAIDVPQATAIMVNNKFCPLSGRELNLADNNDYTQLTVEGLSFNVCPIAMVKYKKDAAPFADKIAAAVNEAKNGSIAKVEEVMDQASVVKEEAKEAVKEVVKEVVKEEVKVEEPKVEEPKVETPVVEMPKVEEPVKAAEPAKTEEPAAAEAPVATEAPAAPAVEAPAEAPAAQ